MRSNPTKPRRRVRRMATLFHPGVARFSSHICAMSTPLQDLSKLRIDRDAPTPGVRRAVVRNAIFALIVFGGLAVVAVVYRMRAVIPVQTVVASAIADPSAGSSGGGRGTSVTANGYVVART